MVMEDLQYFTINPLQSDLTRSQLSMEDTLKPFHCSITFRINSLLLNEFEHYFDLIDEVGLFFEDLNAHHKSWETNSRDNFSGKSLFSNLNQFNNLCLLNPINFETRTDPHSGKTSNKDHIMELTFEVITLPS